MIGSHNQDFRKIPPLWRQIGGLRALDLGCGGGLYTCELAKRGARAVGLDLQMDNLVAARREAGEGKIFWVRGDATRLPFREGVFQLVVSAEVLTHLPPEMRQATFSEVHRVARAQAAVYLTLHNRARLSLSQWLRLRRARRVYETPNLKVWPTQPAEARRLAGQCGLESCPGLRYLNYHSRFTQRFYERHPWLARLLILAEAALSHLPLLRCLAITFLLQLKNGARG